jgi:hypothetical protein
MAGVVISIIIQLFCKNTAFFPHNHYEKQKKSKKILLIQKKAVPLRAFLNKK